MTASSALARVRTLCLALPETTERISNGSPCFFVRGKSTFVMFMDNHHRDGRLAIWCAAPDGMQHDLIASDSERFFRPPYVGHRGWIGVRLDTRSDWPQIAAFITDAYRIVAPPKLLMRLDSANNR
jgi:predicted DNA-binding protein (MmcQ/YjbR family)